MKKIYICERRFELPDPDDPMFSKLEIDIYTSISISAPTFNHRLVLRKNITTGKFELSRIFYFNMDPLKIRKETIIKGDFRTVLEKANSELEKFREREERRIYPCSHREPEVDPLCPGLLKVENKSL